MDQSDRRNGINVESFIQIDQNFPDSPAIFVLNEAVSPYITNEAYVDDFDRRIQFKKIDAPIETLVEIGSGIVAIKREYDYKELVSGYPPSHRVEYIFLHNAKGWVIGYSCPKGNKEAEMNQTIDQMLETFKIH